MYKYKFAFQVNDRNADNVKGNMLGQLAYAI